MTTTKGNGCKLNATKVKAIRRADYDKPGTVAKFAKKYGVDEKTIRKARDYETYQWVMD